MRKKKSKKCMMVFWVTACLFFTACGTQEGREEEHTSFVSAGTTAMSELTEDKTGNGQGRQQGAEDGSGQKTADTTDDLRFYDSSPNTAEPRAYTENEIALDITEDRYVACVNDIYVYAEDYLGMMIRIEGMYLGETYEGTDYHYIYRHGPGCCDTDGEMCGFEFTYNGDMPGDGDWIEVVGTLRQYLEGNFAYLTLDAISVTVKEERGAEDVKE